MWGPHVPKKLTFTQLTSKEHVSVGGVNQLTQGHSSPCNGTPRIRPTSSEYNIWFLLYLSLSESEYSMYAKEYVNSHVRFLWGRRDLWFEDSLSCETPDLKASLWSNGQVRACIMKTWGCRFAYSSCFPCKQSVRIQALHEGLLWAWIFKMCYCLTQNCK